MKNLLSRFTVQIELWKNILSLRAGQFYSKSSSFLTTVDDNISRLTNVLASYEWTYFDSPDMSHVQDEGTMLRKILAVFSIRPTLTQIASYINKAGIGYTNLGSVSRSTFIYTPVCNVKLPVSLTGTSVTSIDLEKSLSQSDWFIENKMLIPKNKSVIYSNKVLFFYVNRRYQSPLTTSTVSFNYVAVPTTMSNLTSINKTPLDIKYVMKLGNDNFNLRSVVIVNPLYDGKLSTGCAALVVIPTELEARRTQDTYSLYNPVFSSSMVLNDDKTKWISNNIINIVPKSHAIDSPTPGFIELAKQYGTVFVYVS